MARPCDPMNYSNYSIALPNAPLPCLTKSVESHHGSSTSISLNRRGDFQTARKPSPTRYHSHSGATHQREISHTPSRAASKRSRKKASLTIRNASEAECMVTLTYRADVAPNDDRVAKRHLDRFKTLLSRQGVSGFWAIEFTKKGVPHFHLLLTGDFDMTKARAAWARITGQEESRYLLHCRATEDHQRAERYIVKANGKVVPEGYRNFGKWFGRFGGAKDSLVFEAEGTSQEIARVMRPFRSAVESRGRRVRDKGRRSYVVWSLKDTHALIDSLIKLCELYGIRYNAPGRARGGF